MSIKAEIQSLSPTALLELFILDATNMPGGNILRFHAGTNGLLAPVVWQNETYLPLPIKADGFDITTKGALPRPKMTIANAGGLLSSEVRSFNDFVGCKVVRKRTFQKYLDAQNFEGNVNPSADPNQHLPDDVWYVERKLTENRYLIEFELSSAMDLQGVQLPARQIIQQSCMWRYRGVECGWNGAFFDKNNNGTADPAQDACAKTLSACKTRFQTSPIRFGGFPGAQRGNQ